MRKRNFLILCLIAALLCVGNPYANAKVYNSFSVNDEITVKLNATTTAEFIVLEDDTENNTVKAIYKGALGDSVAWNSTIPAGCTYDNSVVKTELTTITAEWSNVTTVTLPSATDIIASFEYADRSKLDELVTETNEGGTYAKLGEINNVPFYALNNTPGSKYYVGSVVDNSGVCEAYVYGSTAEGVDYFYVNANSEEASLRPVITVSKDYVVDGFIPPIDWDTFVAKFKTTELYEEIDSYDGITIDVTDTASTLKIVLTEGTDVYTTNFTYSGGILTFDNSGPMTLFDAIWVSNSINTVCDIKGYNYESVLEWLKEGRTLAADGIELDYDTYATVSDDIDEYTEINTFKLDLENVLVTFNPADYVITGTDNPQTGDITRNLLIIVGIAMIISAIAYIKSRKISKFPHA